MDGTLHQDFDAKRADEPITGLVAGAARDHKYFGIADTSHGCVEIHELGSSKQFMEGLALGNKNNLGIEVMAGGMIQVFRAYRDGVINDDELQYFGQKAFENSFETDYGVDPVRMRQTIIDYMKNAKELGIELHPIESYAGFYTEEEYEIFNKADIAMFDSAISIVAEDSKYKSLPEDEKFTYLQGEIRAKMEDDPEFGSLVREALSIKEAAKKEIVRKIAQYQEEGMTPEEAKAEVDDEMLTVRYGKDYKVAERAKEAFGDEGGALIYGRQHFDRRFKDLDAKLGDMPVLEIYADKQAQDAERTPRYMQNRIFFEKPEYTINIKNGTWQEGDNPPVSLDVAERDGAMAPVQSAEVDNVCKMGSSVWG